MCTVSFVPVQGGFVLTSNRDEKIDRPTISPKVYSENEVKLLYPKDSKAGGTWIVTKEDGTTIILLNGAFVNHLKKPNYSKSRGVILMEIIKAEDALFHFSQMDLHDVEPFTLIVFQNNTLTEVKWDEVEKHSIHKSTKRPHIWSSATLYNRKQKNTRRDWFDVFCRSNNPLSLEKILSFHTNTHASNTEYGLVINREDKTKTVSITQLLLKHNKLEMTYIDRIKNEIIEKITF